ncbi:hypothetical protein MZM54_04350 [[Brevibacterium] frigoritolerans]|nr:hypothetical protein [Peribacillus frigoritolerans]
MLEIMKKYDLKITYGKSKRKYNGGVENWIGILPFASGNPDTEGFRLTYVEKDNRMVVYKATDDGKEITSTKFFFVFPLLKLLEKAKKKGINEVEVTTFERDMNKFFGQFMDRIFVDNRLKKLVLNEQKMNELVDMIETVTYHPAVWEVKQISSNIIFRTKTGYMDIIWNHSTNQLLLRECSEKDLWKEKDTSVITKSSELEGYLRNMELTETFQPLLEEQVKRMFFRLTSKRSSETEPEELNEFTGLIRTFSNLEDIEKQLLVIRPIEKRVCKNRMEYYDFNHFVVGAINTTQFGKRLFVESKENLPQLITKYLNEDVVKSLEELVI